MSVKIGYDYFSQNSGQRTPVMIYGTKNAAIGIAKMLLSAQGEVKFKLDVCVDGEFEVDKKELSLKWKGSSNQRVIDVPKTLHEGKVVLHK
jgi:hypothetical protein